MRVLPASCMRAGLVLLLAATTSCKSAAMSPPPVPTVTSAPTSAAPALEAVPRAALCVTEGSLTSASKKSIHVDEGGMRAVRAGDDSSVAELEFVYRGPSAETLPLASGELRRQIGLKLHAKDTCNVLYVMWYAAPTPGIHVSVKQNTGKSFHSQCGDGGYTTPKPEFTRAVAPIVANTPNTLRAELDGSLLRVTANGTEVWRGQLPAEALTFEGPAGVRTDNGIFDFELRVPHGASTAGTCSKP